jgi:hypothetical protein
MNSSFLLRHAKSGLFFDGTNFSAEAANKATRFDVALGRPPVALVWADPVQVIEISSGQIAALDLADFLEERAQAHVLKAPSVASRHRRRASELAAAVYGSFPRLGHA